MPALLNITLALTGSESGDCMKSNTNFVEGKSGEGMWIVTVFAEKGSF